MKCLNKKHNNKTKKKHITQTLIILLCMLNIVNYKLQQFLDDK